MGHAPLVTVMWEGQSSIHVTCTQVNVLVQITLKVLIVMSVFNIITHNLEWLLIHQNIVNVSDMFQQEILKKYKNLLYLMLECLADLLIK